ncbi:MMPL family transporter [Ideonella sp. YS5]|uniref:MMPL family transporter n=1 Tax=Ideonella sp. YS5 TaxID=3453714 RepID=UPI003EEA7C24
MPARRSGVLAAWLAFLLACGLVISRAPFVADMSAFLPASPDPAQQLLIEQIQQGAPSRTLLVGITGGDAAQRAEASRALAGELRASGLFEQVQNGERDAWREAGEWIVEHRYLLSPAVTPERFTVQGLRDAIEDSLSLLGTPAGAAVKPLLGRDPTGETQRIAESMIPTEAPRMEQGVWVSRQAPRALLLASTKAAGSDLDGQARVLQRIREAFAPSARAGLGLQLSGAPVIAVGSRERIQHEAAWLAGSGALVMGSLLWLAFGSLRALAVAALPVATGVLAGIAAVALGFGHVHGMTLGFGSTLMGEAVDYAIYYLIQAQPTSASDPPGNGWKRWLRESWPTVRLGLLTSLTGFVVLAFSGFPGLAQLGVFSISGLVAAAAAARWVLPRLMPDGAPPSRWRRPLGRGLARALPWLQRSRWLWPALALLALGMVANSHGRLWQGELSALSPVAPAELQLDEQLQADLSTADGGSLLIVRGADLETALRGAEAAGRRLDQAVAEGLLASFDSPARLLPSQATQAARRASLPQPPVLQASLREAVHGGALEGTAMDRFLAEAEQARQAPLLTRETMLASPLGPLLSTLLAGRSDGSWTALLPLHPLAGRPLDTAAVGRLLADVPGAQVLEIKPELDRLYAGYLDAARWQAALGALAVLLLLAAWRRSLLRAWRVALPLALSVLLCLGGLHAAGVQLGVLHWVGLMLVVAVGSNYALFFDAPVSGAYDEDTLASLLLANATAVLSFGLIALSEIPVLAAIGQVVAPGALLALAISAAFAPRAATPARTTPV